MKLKFQLSKLANNLKTQNMSFNLNQIESQKGKIAIVTGANTGLGKEITIGLARKEVKVIMACRSIKKAEEAKTEIIKIIPNANIEIMELDLSSLKSVRNFAKSFSEKYKQLNFLIENAGIMIPPFKKQKMVLKVKWV
jgi:NAD(P)-dependent dehydrogenase (short-subunit alcohol dehydrogenase family)